METKEVFDTLIKAATTELEKVQQEGSAYFASGDTIHVREAADLVEKIQAVIHAVGQLKDLWDKAIPIEGPIIRPLPLEKQYQRTPRGIKTPQERYWLPILQALVDLGGKGRTGLVLDRLGEIMADILNDFDQENLPGRQDIRWRNTASWARAEMVKAGYLSDRSPHGTWEITDEGRKYLKNRAGQQARG
jgi:hypothetical protein